MKRKILAIALGAALAAPAVSAGTVTVLTSFPNRPLKNPLRASASAATI